MEEKHWPYVAIVAVLLVVAVWRAVLVVEVAQLRTEARRATSVADEALGTVARQQVVIDRLVAELKRQRQQRLEDRIRVGGELWH